MKTKSWFQRLLSTYLPIFYLVIFFLIFVFFMTVSQMSRQQTAKANDSYAKYVMQALESALQNIDRVFYRELDTDPDIQAFLFRKEDTGESEYLLNSRLANKFKTMGVSYPLIHSIYLYRDSDRRVLTSNAIMSSDNFGDHEFAEELAGGEAPYTWTGVRDYRLFSFDPLTSVVSLVRKVPLQYESRGFLVINVSVSGIRGMVDEMATQNVGSTGVYDALGKAIVGSVNDNLQGMSLVKSSYMMWEVRTGLIGGSAYGVILNFFYGWIALGFAVILLGTVGIVFVTRRYTSPLDAIVRRIKSYSKSRSKELAVMASGQPQFFETAFDHLLEMANLYTDVHHENLVYRRKTFFIELVGGERRIDASAWEEETGRFGMTAGYRELGIGILDIDKYPGFCGAYSYQDQNLIKFVISSVVKETAAEMRVAVWSEWLENERLTVLFRTEEPEPGLRSEVAVLCDRIRLWIQDNLEYTVTIGIGSVVEELGDVPRSFDEAEEALTYKSSAGMNRIIAYSDTERGFQLDSFVYLQLIRSIADSFKLRDADWKIKFAELVDHMRSRLFLRQDMVNLLQYMIFHISKEVWDLPVPYKEAWDRVTPELSGVLKDFDTLEDVRERLEALLDEAAARFEQLRPGKQNQELIRNVKAYIEAHYHSPDLSLGLLSSEYGIHQSNLSRLFKEEIGENFVDYLARIRILRAKELLQTTVDSIQDIAGRVGYLHYFSFNRVFKKLMGLTPGEYRRSAASELEGR
ncbi:helix-turn-helix domain-containing protein [Paenibacillus sepulcri]